MERSGATQHGHFRDGRVVVGEFSTGRGRVRRKHPADDGRIRRRNDRQDERVRVRHGRGAAGVPEVSSTKERSERVTTPRINRSDVSARASERFSLNLALRVGALGVRS